MGTIYTLEFAPNARSQYLEIIDYYLEFASVERALKVENSFSEIFSKIIESPFSFGMYAASGEIKESKRRALVDKTYIMVFEISNEIISVIDIYHAARNPSDHI